MKSLEQEITVQEAYVEHMKDRVDYAKWLRDDLKLHEEKLILNGAQETLHRMYDERIGEGVSFI